MTDGDQEGNTSRIFEFDVLALFGALDERRVATGLSWSQVAREMWDQSADLNLRRADHPISPSTITGMAKRDNTTCQHALFMLRWLGRTPESFLSVATRQVAGSALPEAGPDRRLRWDLTSLYEALDAHRRDEALTWQQLARQLRCTTNQLTGIRVARYAITMRLAMRIVQWLGRPAADFIHAAEW